MLCNDSFLTQVNQDDRHRLRVRSDYHNSGVGKLYRYIPIAAGRLQELWSSLPAPCRRVSSEPAIACRIADGIVHGRLRAFDTNGMQINLTNNIRECSVYPMGCAGPARLLIFEHAVPSASRN